MTPAPGDSGVYLFVLDVAGETQVTVGALGPVQLAPGRYGYVGSARRGLAARLARHARQAKPRRWHIDYLAEAASAVGALTWPWRPGRECRLARALTAGGLGVPRVPRFGASDCRCPTHLFALAETDLARLAAGLSRRLGAAEVAVSASFAPPGGGSHGT